MGETIFKRNIRSQEMLQGWYTMPLKRANMTNYLKKLSQVDVKWNNWTHMHAKGKDLLRCFFPKWLEWFKEYMLESINHFFGPCWPFWLLQSALSAMVNESASSTKSAHGDGEEFVVSLTICVAIKMNMNGYISFLDIFANTARNCFIFRMLFKNRTNRVE